MPTEIEVVAICEHMHWTFQQYEAQPLWLLDALRVKLGEDGTYQRQQSNRKK